MAPVEGTSTKMDKKVEKSWADQMEDYGDNDADDSLPPSTEVIDGQMKITTEYKLNSEGKKMKIVRYYRIETIKVPKAIATRKSWSKFGASASDPPGPNPATTYINEEIFMQFISNRDDEHLDAVKGETDPGDALMKMKLANKNLVKCRHCEMDHWTTKCPYKDKLEQLDSIKAKNASALAANDFGSTADKNDDRKTAGGKYLPPQLRDGGSKRGESMTMSTRSKDEANTLRVTNLPEEIQDSDIRELFNPFGRVTRIFLAKDKHTGQSKGFAFVSFDKKEDALAAIKNVNGYGYANLILSVEWAKPSGN